MNSPFGKQTWNELRVGEIHIHTDIAGRPGAEFSHRDLKSGTCQSAVPGEAIAQEMEESL
jgi:hypothetical protein